MLEEEEKGDEQDLEDIQTTSNELLSSKNGGWGFILDDLLRPLRFDAMIPHWVSPYFRDNS